MDESLTVAPAQIAASGRTSGTNPYETLLVVSQPRDAGDACEMRVHLEYLGPHELLLYDATVTVANGRLTGAGDYSYSIEDCSVDRGTPCTCDSRVTLTGTI